MEFSEKLNVLMGLAGLTNSKVAKAITVDPSLVSRWRSGSRRPAANTTLLVQIASYVAGNLVTGYHRRKLCELIGDSSLEQASRQELIEAIFVWLNGAEPPADAQPQLEGGSTPFSEHEMALNNMFAGPQGRRLVLRQLVELHNPHRVGESLLFYSGAPADWIQEDIAYRDTILQQRPHLFDNITTIKLIVHHNATIAEYISLIQFLMPFLKNGIIHMAQIPHYRKELFNNTILIAGSSVAAASHSFAHSSNFMTNLYSNEAFVGKLAMDYNRLFATCERITTIEEKISVLDIIDEIDKMLLLPASVVFMGNMVPILLAPPEMLLEMMIAEYGALEAHDYQRQIFEHARQNAEFLETQKIYIYMPLFTPEEVNGREAVLAGMPEKEASALNARQYLCILRQLLLLLETHTNLSVYFISKLDHMYSLMIQENMQVYALHKSTGTFYTTKLAGLVQALFSYATGKHATLQQAEQGRARQMELLRAAITRFEADPA